MLQRGRRGRGILGSQRVLGFGSKPLEGETPARSLARRHPPVPAHVRARSCQRHEVVDLVLHHLRIDRRLSGTRRATAPVARELDLDTLPHVRRAAPVEVPQCLPQAILVELGHHAEELLAVHSLRRHEGDYLRWSCWLSRQVPPLWLPAISRPTSPTTLFHLLSPRLVRVPSAAARRGQVPIAGPLRAVVDPPNRYQETPFIVIRKHRSTSRRCRRHYCTISSRAALWRHIAHADRLGTAGMGRNTCANQRPHLRLQSSAF